MFRAGLLATVLLLGGCSTTKLVYNNADWLVWRWVDELLDPSRAQQDAWRGAIGQLLERHREELLPHLLRFLADAENAVDQGLSSAVTDCLFAQMGDLYHMHAALVLPLASQLLLQLQPPQIDHLQAALEQRNREYRDKYLDADLHKRQEARVARYRERIERWTGTLEESQRQLLQRQMADVPDLAEDWLAYRQQQQRHLLQLLRTNASADSVRWFMADWWLRRAAQPGSLPARQQIWQQQMGRLGVALYATLDSGQRTHLRRQIQKVRSDLAELVEPGLNSTSSLAAGPCSSVRSRDD